MAENESKPKSYTEAEVQELLFSNIRSLGIDKTLEEILQRRENETRAAAQENGVTDGQG